jgi:hypothetical protein
MRRAPERGRIPYWTFIHYSRLFETFAPHTLDQSLVDRARNRQGRTGSVPDPQRILSPVRGL